MTGRLPLIAEVNHVADALGMCRVELVRILCLKCDDISDSIQPELLPEQGSKIALWAGQFTFLYTLLEKYFSADSAAMAHWLRRKNASLCTTPLLTMVDQGRMEDVIAAILRKG